MMVMPIKYQQINQMMKLKVKLKIKLKIEADQNVLRLQIGI